MVEVVDERDSFMTFG